MKTSAGILLLVAVLEAGIAQEPPWSVSGIVLDAETHMALEGANVVVRGTSLGAATDGEGRFTVTGLTAHRYTVAVSMIGYRTIVREFVRGSETSASVIQFSLVPAAVETEQIVVTASRREQEAREVPVSLAVVTASALADRNIVTMDDALRYVPGVNMLEDQVNIRGSSGYSRGVGSRVLLLLDGLPFLTGDTGEINWETVPVADVERVEIIKGAGSALYGSSALGGVINVITRPVPESGEIRFRAFSGIYDRPPYREWHWSERTRFNSGLIIGMSARTGSLGYLLSVTRTVDDSHLENDATHRWALFGKGSLDLSAERNLSAMVNVLTRKHGNFFWWKSLREATRPADIQRDGSVEGTRGNVSLAFRETVSDRLFYVIKTMYFGNFWRDDSAGHVNNVSASHVMQTDAQVTYGISESNILTMGVAANLDEVHSNLFGDHQGYGLAAYVQDEWTLPHEINLTAGVRFDFQRASVLAGAGRLSPKLGATMALSDDVVVRASLGGGFRYPSIGELFISSATNVSQLVILPNLTLRPERSVTGEAGISSRHWGFLDIDASVFWNEFFDFIEPSVKIKNISTGPSDTVGTDRAVVEFENVTRARIQGAEIGLKFSWLRRVLSTDVGYTLLWPEDVEEGSVLKFRPRHMVYAAALLNWGQFRISGDYRFVSRVDRIDDQLVQLAPIIHGDTRVPIHTVDLRISTTLADWGLPLRAGLAVTNVFNYQYVELIGNLAPPRTYTIMVEGIF